MLNLTVAMVEHWKLMKENLDRERNRETWQMQKTKRLVVGDEMVRTGF